MFFHCLTCKKDIEPGILKETLQNKQVVATTQAVCPECRSVLNINNFMLKTLASLGRFYSAPKVQSAFTFVCKKCNKVGQPLLQNNNKALCSFCGEDLQLSPFTIKAMSLTKAGSIDPA
jgi:DNA-directed RNA polymerase subunit RPC12/RpoP